NCSQLHSCQKSITESSGDKLGGIIYGKVLFLSGTLIQGIKMRETSGAVPIKEVLPRKGLLYQEDSAHLALCRPKLMPLKSVTLEKLEAMQKEAQEKSRQQQDQQSEGTSNGGNSQRFF
ncbi:unnamed protein product, partial [Meganyctiphanes norvegica]